jgi:hypothetical protein
VSPRTIEAISLEYRAWTLLLQELIDDMGAPKATREILRSEAWLRTRFTSECYIEMHSKIAKERDSKSPRTVEDYLADIERAEGRKNPLRSSQPSKGQLPRLPKRKEKGAG